MVNIAILGFGTVGSGVAEVLSKNASHIGEKVETPVQVKYILDVREFPDSPFADKFVKDFSVIENDPSIDIVVETIGGAAVALDFTRRALSAGKSVVSSNKELVAEHGWELIDLATKKGVSYLFEASVGGGIPILRPLSQCLAANELTEVVGILNGTTNYILTRMIQGGLGFDDALKEAQALGYAEADPTADVEGHDACRKICILAALAFGRHVYPRQVPTQGITGVTLSDVAWAERAGCKIKLLGRAIHQPDGKIAAYVAPHLVPVTAPLAGVEDVFNAITVRGDAIGDVMFYGRGAGKLPTASAVVADVMDAARHIHAKKHLEWGPGGEDVVGDPASVVTPWYVRAKEVPAQVPAIGNPDAPAGETAFLTPPMTRGELDALLGPIVPFSAFRVLEL